MQKLPQFLKEYFWDVEFKNIDINKRKSYILRRILEYGDKRAITWMLRNFQKTEIEKELVNFRSCSQKSANFWALIFNIKKEKIQCLNKPFRQTQKKFWPY